MALDPAVMSLFNAAFDKIEAVAKIDKDGDALATTFVYSGGRSDTMLEHMPSIHLTQDAAITDWQGQAIDWLSSERAATFRFAEAPKVEKLMMTETDGDGAQRLTVTRYGVTSKLALLSRLPDESPVAAVEPEVAAVEPAAVEPAPAKKTRKAKQASI